MTYGFSIKLKRGVPSRTKIRTELPLVLSYPAHISTDIVCSGLFPGKGSGHSCFPSVVIIAESMTDTVNFFLCYRLDKHRALLLIYFLFVPAVTVGPAGGKGVLPHKFGHAARFAHGVVQTAQGGGRLYRPSSFISTHIPMGIPAYFIVCLQIRSSRSAFSSRCPRPWRETGKSR